MINQLEILGREVKTQAALFEQHDKISENEIFEKDKNLYISKNISFIKKIIMDYKYRFFSIEFAALNISNPKNVKYAYKMEDMDQDWIFSGKRNYVSYAGVHPGKYVFKVKALNRDGLWSEVLALKLIINPPFWKTWWFLLFEILAFIAILILIFQYFVKVRTNKLLRIQNQTIKIANQKLTESERNLKELNATKDKFFSIISHDLKNPFASLFSMSELLVQNFSSSSEKEKLFMVRKNYESVKLIYELLENLLTWTQSQRGKIEFTPVEFNISKIIEINSNLHRIQAEKKGVKLISQIADEILAFGDREMINTVVRNLINNAIKFTPGGKNIEIGVNKNDHFVEVFVKDEGIGISRENVEKLFRIDKKVKSIGTNGEKGTGLGLILCKEFIEKNSGKIKVESEVDKGSIFSFTIPSGKHND